MDNTVKIRLDELRSELRNYEDRLEDLRGRFDVARKTNRLKEIGEMEALEGFWEDADHAAKIEKEKSVLNDVVETYEDLKTAYDEFDVLVEFAAEGDDGSATEAITVAENFLKMFKKAEQKVLLSGEQDANNAIVSINAGAGGTESCDWASMLERMVIHWSEHKKFKLTMMDEQPGDSAGIKSATILVEGNFAYGQLKSESGVHRLVRISPFDSQARRHTSFASIYVTPEVDDTINIEILDKDIRIDVFRSSGAGGQSVNTTDSAVRITHIPTNIVVNCQAERSQLKNKERAMGVLKSRLFDLEMAKRREKLDEAEAGKKEIGWGAQIRSYVLHPYKMVKDHRTGFESSNTDKVLNGHIDGFMDAFLRWSVSGETIRDDGELE
ncbi:MAG: peptide chain release factor 2 [Halobacteriovorax sp.]|nr:peptide chain release factor 2 [Halobacteriovorax sp.]